MNNHEQHIRITTSESGMHAADLYEYVEGRGDVLLYCFATDRDKALFMNKVQNWNSQRNLKVVEK